jgi:hypothetical protein
MTGEPHPAPEDENRAMPSDIVSAVVLSAAALATAYASYQAELWDGEQAALYTEANGYRVAASEASLHAGQVAGADLMVFGAWLSARAANETELEAFYLRRFRPEFTDVFNAWVATDPGANPAAPPTPFAMQDYEAARRREVADLEENARNAFVAGENANEKGDAFVLVTVILANALFFGGINQIAKAKRTRRILLAISLLFCAVGIVRLAVLPPAP